MNELLYITNYEAGSIFEYECGVREHYDTTRAVLTTSLFRDFLEKNGLKVHKEESTRDIICIEFNYGSRSYEQELKHIQKTIVETRNKIEVTDNKNIKDNLNAKLERLLKLEQDVIDKSDKFVRRSANDLRTQFYENGVTIHYPRESIHYKMLYRTPGKAKKGSCMFIRDSLYKKARNFLYMGIKLPKQNAPIVEIGAYSSLITSSIEGRIKIEPQNILVLKDVDSFFTTNVVSIGIDENKHCVAKHINDYKLKNTLFDGQALIDESIFPEWANGYILLRHHFCKMAAFVSRLQLYFRDKFGDEYETAELVDMWGGKHLAKDIKLITTNNAMKWYGKFNNITYEYWSEWVRANDCQFGIVKTAHPSKLGKYQRMSYQMVNALDIDSIPSVMEDTLSYIRRLKTDDAAFLEFLRKNQNFSNDYEPLIKICEQNPDFLKCDYFRSRKGKILESYTNKVKFGKVLQNADNLVIVGSPYAMLMHAVGEDAESDPTFAVEDGAMQCWTSRFTNGEYLAEFRSPFNSRNNLGLLHNVWCPEFDKYFPFGDQIIAVNMIGTCMQDRNNGSDQDSDSIFVTNQPDIVEHARNCMRDYPTVVNNIPKSKKTYTSSPADFAKVDNGLASSQLSIGESSNLAQLCLTYTYSFAETKSEYEDYCAILAVVAQAAIDSAKRTFDVDIPAEIKRIKNEINVKKNGYPKFWHYVRPDLTSKINKDLRCPMNSVCDATYPTNPNRESNIPFANFIVNKTIPKNKKPARHIEELIAKYSWFKYQTMNQLNDGERYWQDEDDYILLQADFELMIQDIRKITLGKKYDEIFYWLINRAFVLEAGMKRNVKTAKTTLYKNKALLMRTLYEVNKELFLSQFTRKIDIVEKTQNSIS